MEPKMKSQCAVRAEELLNQAAVLELIDASVTPDTWIYGTTDRIDLNPNTEDTARKLVGSLIRLLKQKPVIDKPYQRSTSLNATFTYSGVRIVVCNYKGKKCAIIKKQIVHEAQPERTEVHPAKEAYVEEVEELVCEMPEVDAEVTPKVEAEVPF